MTLRELDAANDYRTDKLGRCPLNPHDYADAIEFHLGPWRDRAFVLWEVGVDRGDSLRLWSDYLPLATVVGIDLREPTTPGYRLPPRCHFRRGSATDPVFVEALAAEFPPDFVIDDGSHRASDLHRTFELVWPHTRAVYCAEDLHTQYPDCPWGTDFLDRDPFTDRLKALGDRLARLESGGPRRVCWEPGQVYLYK